LCAGPTRLQPQVEALTVDGAVTDLSEVPLLAALPERARLLLEAATRVRPVAAGEWLLREGDPPGSAYVVRSGRLRSRSVGRVVRELGPGAVLGELALLTGEPRSAGVRARRDSSVLEVPRDAFDEMLGSDPVATRVILGQVAERLRTAGGGGAEVGPPTQPVVVAVVGLHAGSGATEVAAALHAHLANTGQ
jgi:CRP-like cAMP-binding protein